ncbi:MAG: Rho termination factor N-terminal domain-containing protein, partial [Lachnospiraceae bacterium]|nr:Rho termination factor N-terminal domain-containing protein [Lachnospiraceae bacterium]
MREKYESLALADLKAIAKARGLKGTSTMKKAELIELMLAEDEKDKAQGKNVPPKSAPAKTAPARQAAVGRTEEKSELAEGRAEGRPEKGEYKAERTEKSEYRTERTEGRVEEQRPDEDKFPTELDSGIAASGILEVMPDGYGFIRCENYLPGDHDVYVAPSQIRRFGLKTGDILEGNTRVRTQGEKFAALLYVKSINGYSPEVASRRCNFEDMTPVFPDERLHLEMPGASVSMRIMDLISPV